MTEMACNEPGVMERENQFAGQLWKCSTIAFHDNQLVLSDGTDQNLLRFTPTVPPQPRFTLQGTKWGLSLFEESDDIAVSVEQVMAGAVPWIQIDGDRLTGSGGVNQVGGKVKVGKEGAVAFSHLASTQMAGPAGAMTQEQRFFSWLEASVRFELIEDRLRLANDDGTRVLIFTGSNAE